MNDQAKQGSVIEPGEGQQAIGFVAATAGSAAVVITADGALKELNPGDRIYAGDSIEAVKGSQVVIAFADGSVRELPREGSFTFSESSHLQLTQVEAYSTGDAEFDGLLAAIAAGEDPQELLEEKTAAGEEGGGAGGDEIGQGLEFDLAVGEIAPSSGIDPTLPQRPLLDPTANATPVESVALEIPVVSLSVITPPIVGEQPAEPTTDTPLLVSGNAASILEGTNGDDAREVTFILQLDKPFDQDVQVTYELRPISADSPEDWFGGDLINTVTIPAGETSFLVTVTIVQDRLDENNEVLEVIIVDATNATVDPNADAASVTIFDDDTTPVARDDMNSVMEDDFQKADDSGIVSTSGNVIGSASGSGSAPSSGDVADTDADGDTLVLTNTTNGTDNVIPDVDGEAISGSYGVLTIYADGSYEYLLNNGSTDIQGLSEGELLEDVFTYTLEEDHGVNGSTTADLTIKIEGADDGVTIEGLTVQGADHSLDEDDLPAGSDDSKEATKIVGSFDIEAKDGIDTVEIAGTTFSVSQLASLAGSPVTISTAAGELTLISYSGGEFGGAINYSYELLNATGHPTGNGENSIFDDFLITVTDDDGSIASSTLTVEIVDDIALAVDHSPVVTPTEDSAIDIDVNADITAGADGVNLVGGLAVTTNPTKGSVVYNNDGTFTYTATAGQTGSDSFVYTVTDGDGDTDTATVSITLAADSEPTVTATDGAVDEAALPDGSNSGSTAETDAGSFSIDTGNDTLVALTVGGVDVTSGGVVNGTYGDLTVTETAGVYTWTYTLAGNTTAHNTQGANIDGVQEDFEVIATDSDGDVSAVEVLTVTVQDDIALAADHTPAVTPAEDSAISIDVTADITAGADGVNLVGGLAVSTNPSKGSVIYNNDGTFTYTPTAGQTGSDAFVYTITDGDGDTDTATVTITLAADSKPIANVDANTVDESDLAFGSGTNPEDVGDNFNTVATGNLLDNDTVNSGADLATITSVNGSTAVSGIITVVTAAGTLLVYTTDAAATNAGFSAAGDYQYTLAAATADGSTDSEVFTYVLTDGDTADTNSSTLTISVLDDEPVAVGHAPAAAPTEDTPIDIDVNADITAGADGVDLTTGVQVTTDPTKGSVQYNSDGTFTYTPTAGQTGNDSFIYTVTDGDGDTDTATVSITLAADSTPTVTVTDGAVDEAALSDGSNPISTAETDTGSFTIATGNDALVTLTVGGVDVTSGGIVNGTYGDLTVTETAGVYTWSYTLSDNTTAHNTPGANIDGIQEDFDVIVTDSDGDVSAVEVLTVTVKDDLATAADHTPAVTPAEDTTIDIDVNADITAGADGVNLVGGLAVTTNPAKGSVIYNSDGTFTYTPTAGQTGSDSFVYTITDGDGDIDTATVSITLSADSTPTVTVTDGAVDEAALSDGSNSGSAAETDTGSFTIATGNDTLVTLTVGGVDVTSGGVVNGNYGDLTVTETAGVYTWSYTLSGNTTAHNTQGANIDGIQEDFDVIVTDSDGDVSAADVLTVTVQDDIPSSTSIAKDASLPNEQAFNVTVVLDISGSMGFPIGDTGETGLSQAQQALKALSNELFTSSDAVSISLITFAGGAQLEGTFNSKTEFDAAVDELVASGATNYNAALADANELLLDTLSQDRPENIEDLLYFISDGQPTAGGVVDGTLLTNGILPVDLPTVFSIGAGTGINATAVDALDEIIPSSQQQDDNGEPIIVTDFNELADTIVDLLPTETAATGNLFTDAPMTASFGADGGSITSVLYSGVSYTLASTGPNVIVTGPSLQVTSSDGILMFDFESGNYEFTASDTLVAGEMVAVSVTFTDGDGDTVDSFLELTITDNLNPTAEGFTLVTNAAAGFSVSANSVEHFGADHEGDSLYLFSAGGAADYIPYESILAVNDGFNFKLVDDQGQASNSAVVDVVRDNNDDTLTGTDGRDLLIAQNTAALISLDVRSGDTFNNNNLFGVSVEGLASGLSVTQIVIDLSNIDNATFDIADNGNGTPFGVSGLIGVSSDDISSSLSNGDQILTITIDPGALANGDSFRFGIDTDENGDVFDDGDHFGGFSVPVTVRLNDNTVLSGSYSSVAGGGSELTFDLATTTDNNTLLAGAGDDVLVGGLGNDILTGGTGSDVFQWNIGDAVGSPTDTITDFTAGAGGDVLDLSALLQGETSGNLDDYLDFDLVSGDTIITADVDGVAGGDTQTIVLSGVDLTAGGALTDAQIINNLTLTENLVTD